MKVVHMLQLSEAYNMLKYVRVLTWHLLPGYLADSRAILEQNNEISKESLALFARNERPHDDI